MTLLTHILCYIYPRYIPLALTYTPSSHLLINTSTHHTYHTRPPHPLFTPILSHPSYLSHRLITHTSHPYSHLLHPFITPILSYSGDETDDEGVSSQWLFDFPFGKKKEESRRSNDKNRGPRDAKPSRSSSGGTSSGSGSGGGGGGRAKDRASSSGRRRVYEDDGYSSGLPQGQSSYLKNPNLSHPILLLY